MLTGFYLVLIPLLLVKHFWVKKFRQIFLIAIITGAGVIAFQLYWLYNIYKLQETELITTATHALKRSNDRYLLQAFASSDSTNPVITIFPEDSIMDPDTITPGNHKTYHTAEMIGGAAEMDSAGISSSLTIEFEQVALQLFTRTYNKPYEKDLFNRIYKEELIASNILLPYQLEFAETIPAKHSQAAYISTGVFKGTVAIYAIFEKSSPYLLKQTVVPILVSLVLMLLTAGCLWYMWHIISRQRLLSDIKNDFINNMTHELKTPVSILKTTHEALHHFGEVANREKTTRYLQINITELDKLQEKVDRILDITQYESGKKIIVPETFNLKKLLSDAIQRYNIEGDNNIMLQYNLRSETIVTDKNAMDTIINNLLDNAVKYCDKKFSVITVEASLLKPDGLMLNVKDNGSGIPVSQQRYIFDKFYRVPTGDVHNVKGYGLGLNYVKQLVTLLNGKITVESKPGEGTLFTVQIPGVCNK